MTAAKKTALLITAVLMAAYMALFFQIMAEGSTTGMYSRTAEGNVYISETGWIRSMMKEKDNAADRKP